MTLLMDDDRRRPTGGVGKGVLACTDGGSTTLLSDGYTEELDTLDEESEDEDSADDDDDAELELLLTSDELDEGVGLWPFERTAMDGRDVSCAVESMILLRLPSPPPSRLPDVLRFRTPSSGLELLARSLTLLNQSPSTHMYGGQDRLT